MENPSSVLRGFVASLLEHEGAAVEDIQPSGLEFIAPESVQRRLKVAEFGRLGFGSELPSGAERVTFESDWIERLGNALGDRGRSSSKVISADLPPLSDPERVIEHGLTLQNAVFRLLQAGPAWTRYWIMTFRYTALSDEKRDGLTHLALNLSSGSTPDEFVGPLTGAAGAVPPAQSVTLAGATGLPPQWSAERLEKVLQRSLPVRILRSLGPFLSSMERRMERDLDRLFHYYDTLRQQSLGRIRRGTSELEREQARVTTIRSEYKAKVSDLEQKYAMTVEVEPVQTLEVIMPVRRFELLVKRRKGERRFHLDWNPVTRRLDPPPCEYSYVAGTLRMVCDDALHLVSPEAHAPCRSCGKEYCRACSPSKCARCGKKA